jgi:hypothetical protein
MLMLEKVGHMKITPATISALVVVSEILDDPVETLRLLCTYVYAPLLDVADERPSALQPPSSQTPAAAEHLPPPLAITMNAAGDAPILPGDGSEPRRNVPVSAPDAPEEGEVSEAQKLREALRRAVPTTTFPLASSRAGARDALLSVAAAALVQRGRSSGVTLLPGADRPLIAPQSNEGRVMVTGVDVHGAPRPTRSGRSRESSPHGSSGHAQHHHVVPRGLADAHAVQWAGLIRDTVRHNELDSWLRPLRSRATASVNTASPSTTTAIVSPALKAPRHYPENATGTFLPSVSPSDELAFHAKRLANLERLATQCTGEGFRQVQAGLEAHDSPYRDALSACVAELAAETEYERGVMKWLAALRPHFEPLIGSVATASVPLAESPTNVAARRVPFHELDEAKRALLPTLFRLLHLMWRHRAQHPVRRVAGSASAVDDDDAENDKGDHRSAVLQPYLTPIRLTGLIRGVADELIEAAAAFVDFNDTFATATESPEFVERMQKVFSVFALFKDAVFTFQEANAAVGGGEWEVPHAALLAHVDIFLERCRDTLDVLDEYRVQRHVASIDAGPEARARAPRELTSLHEGVPDLHSGRLQPHRRRHRGQADGRCVHCGVAGVPTLGRRHPRRRLGRRSQCRGARFTVADARSSDRSGGNLLSLRHGRTGLVEGASTGD